MPNPTTTDSTRGVLQRIIYFNEENHYCIGEFRLDKENTTITILGNLPGVQCGETLDLSGQWTTHPTHGQQFKIQSFQSRLPSSIHGIRMYLGSGLVPGVGKVYANKIVDHFKEKTLTVINEESARLREVPGIGPQRAKAIKAAWDEQQAFREVFLFLKTYGVTTLQCLRLVKQYGHEAATILKQEPYRMAHDMRGIGFKTADKIALNLGLASDGPARLDAGILYTLQEMAGEGHTCTTPETLLNRATELLDTDPSKIQDRFTQLIQNKHLIELPNSHLQSSTLHEAEESIASSLGNILAEPSALPPIHTQKALQWAQTRAKIEFAPEQTRGIECALSSKISVITGGPGTGKTTILRALVDILKAKKTNILLAAPTGRAAQRMSQATRSYAQTIHRMLKFDPNLGGFTHRENNALKTDFIIIDEASMLDTTLAKALFRAIPTPAHLLLVGDINQLPSVGPGNILGDIIAQHNIPTVSLNKIFRQKDCSNIVTTAHAILEGNPGAPFIRENTSKLEPRIDLQFIKAPDPESCIQEVLNLYKHHIPNIKYTDPLMDVQVLAPMHKGAAGIATFNQTLQSHLGNPNNPSISIGYAKFQTGDKVIQTRNNYDKHIYNGDLGKITHINQEAGSITVQFDNNEVDLERSEWPDLHLAYAISIHKSQGSEFPVVIMPLLKSHFVMLKRNLLYTGITRGRKKVFLVGDPTAYAMAVSNIQSGERLTNLKEKLQLLSPT